MGYINYICTTRRGIFLPLGDLCPKLKTKLIDDKKVAVVYIEVSDKDPYYNAAIKCNTIDELKARIDELKEHITKLWNKFQELKSTSVPQVKSKYSSKYSKKRESKFKKNNGFFRIELPEEIDLAIKNIMIKGEHDYVLDLINLYDNNKICSSNDISYTEEFLEIINKLKSFQ